jgi:hypothetical protein
MALFDDTKAVVDEARKHPGRVLVLLVIVSAAVFGKAFIEQLGQNAAQPTEPLTHEGSPTGSTPTKSEAIERPVPRPNPQLFLTLERMALTQPSGQVLRSQTLEASGVAPLATAAADWVRAALSAEFPVTEPTLAIEFNPTNPTPTLRADPLTVRFWMFGDGLKSHPDVHQSSEAIRKAVETARQRNAPLVFHFERPGYDLEFLEVQSPQPPERLQVALRRRENPLFVVVVDLDNDELRARLRASLSGQDIRVQEMSALAAFNRAYEESRTPGFSHEHRVTLLRQARIDAVVKGKFTSTAASVEAGLSK